MANEIKVHEVEYLSASTGKIEGRPGVVITIRPDEGSFRPHNLGLLRSQAERLLEDLKRLFTTAPLFLLLISTGCSTKVDVTTESRTPAEMSESVEKVHTSVGIDVLGDRGEPTQSCPEEPPALPEGKVRSIEVDGDGNIVIVIDGDGQEQARQKVATKKPTSGWNTKIGWPTQLRGESRWTVSCYLAVWGLIIGSIALMIDNLRRREGGPLLSIIAMLGVAAVLLQLLPHAESGIQFVPLSPWAYVGWESFFVSLACWTAILAAGFVLINGSSDSPQAFAILCLGAMFLNAVLSWSDLKEDAALRSQAPACQQVVSDTPFDNYARVVEALSSPCSTADGPVALSSNLFK